MVDAEGKVQDTFYFYHKLQINDFTKKLDCFLFLTTKLNECIRLEFKLELEIN